jgi:protein-tyrosine phosphatase
MNPDLFWIPGPWRGRLAVATRPRGGEWIEDEAGSWRRTGLDIVVSLLEKEEAAQLDLLREGEAAESQGVHFISFPIPDRGVPASTRDALSLLKDLAVRLAEGKSVAVHCRQSVGRSALIAAGVLVTFGVAADKAIQAVSAARGQTVPETPEQLQWIHYLPSEHPVLTPGV